MKKMYAIFLGFMFVGSTVVACGKDGCSHGDQEKPTKEKPQKEQKD